MGTDSTCRRLGSPRDKQSREETGEWTHGGRWEGGQDARDRETAN